MGFKRNEELITKVTEILDNSNLSASDKETIQTLLGSYKDKTYKEHEDRHKFYQDIVSDMVNDYGFDDDGLAEKMANEHPTIQQSFTRFVAKYIKKVRERGYADGRNQASLDFCEAVGDLTDTYFPFV